MKFKTVKGTVVIFLISLSFGCCNRTDSTVDKKSEFVITSYSDGVQSQTSLDSLRLLFKNNDIQSAWSKRIHEDEYILVLEKENFEVLHVCFQKDSMISKILTTSLTPNGECELSIDKVAHVTKNYLIVSNKSSGSAYCADFPIVFDLKNFKRLQNESIEINEFSYPEMSKHFFKSEVSYIEKKKRLLARINRYELDGQTQDTVGVKEFEKIVFAPN
jgi:hypothetical protein